MPFDTHAAFRCKNCGHLESADHAGENLVPHACSVCDCGVTHSPTVKAISEELCKPELTVQRRLELAQQLTKVGQEPKQLCPDNWEVLADLSEERLEELGLHPERVCKHEPKKLTTPRNSVYLTAEGTEGAGIKDQS